MEKRAGSALSENDGKQKITQEECRKGNCFRRGVRHAARAYSVAAPCVMQFQLFDE